MADGVVVLRGAAAVRALAHPARLTVVDELYAGDVERTATELAALCDLTPSAMSYHLRALEKAGILERAPARGDARERPWRGRGRTIEVATDRADSSDTLASDLLTVAGFDRQRQVHAAWSGYRRQHPGETGRTASQSTGVLRLTSEEAEELVAEVHAATERFLGSSAARTSSGDTETDRYAFHWTLFPDVTALARDPLS